ncbi:MAG: CRTAC1 family protein [Isosphaeraceae bacterium]
MRNLMRLALAAFFCLGVAGTAAVVLVNPELLRWGSNDRPGRHERARAVADSDAAQTTAEPAQKAVYDIIPSRFEDGGYETAVRHAAPIRDPGSLQELRESVRGRGRRGIAALKKEFEQLRPGPHPTKDQLVQKVALEQSIGFLYMYEGNFLEATGWLGQALEDARDPQVPAQVRQRLMVVLGIVAMRRGEVENCIECAGPSSCIFPIASEAMHRKQEGSREAEKWFTAYLEESPRDLRVNWLLNIVAMTVGDYPDRVPAAYRLPLGLLSAGEGVGRFENVAAEAGLTVRGPNLAGGSVFDDFNGDGRPDLFTTSLDADLGASLYLNRGDGHFDDRSASAGLGDQVYALNVTRADYDNDGDLDVLLLRGAWERPLRLSLLRNRGDGTFDDVTADAGMLEPIQTESAAWGDYDNDGLVDVFVCGEYLPPGGKPLNKPGDPRNRCRLYHNEGNGRFKNVAAAAGVLNERCGKGSAWGHYDGDGRLDLFVSNMGQPCRLYHNEGNGRFKDVAPELGVTGADMSFACWFWDYDNDGRLDLYVNDYRATVAEVLASAMGVKIAGSSHPRLYHNLGEGEFREVSADLGLDRAMAPMGVNFGDVDNDGFLDLYLGTGDMSYEGLDVKLMFRNIEGQGFEDVTGSSGTGHLQKGHGVSFADYDGDGDLDLFVELGGATPGDQAYNALFRNPGTGRHWLKAKRVGTRTNLAALGASLRVDLLAPDGQIRSIHRTIGNNSSFGGNPLVETIGLAEATRVASITVLWPTSRTSQTFHDIEADQEIEITEGSDSFRRLPRWP